MRRARAEEVLGLGRGERAGLRGGDSVRAPSWELRRPWNSVWWD